MKAPDKLYYPRHAAHQNNLSAISYSPSTFKDDIEYIRKDAILEWANNWEKIGVSDDFAYAIQTLIKHINAL